MSRAWHGIWVAAVAAVTFAADFLSKKMYFGIQPGMPGFTFVQGWIQQVVHRNYGITANVPLPTALTVTITVIALGFVVVIAHFSLQDRAYWRAFFLAMLFGGALGNLVDRLMFGYVRDWFLLFNRSAMNLADFAILIGLLGAYFISHQAKAQPVPQTPQTT
jgi:signal peptidase II